MRAVVVLLLLALASPAEARRGPGRTEPIGVPPPYALIVGRYPQHAGEFKPASVPPAPAGAPDLTPMMESYKARVAADPSLVGKESFLAARNVEHGVLRDALAWHIRFVDAKDPELFRAYSELLAEADEELGWWAAQRAIELGHPAKELLAERCRAWEKKWAAEKRPDPPTAEQYQFARNGAERWVKAFQDGERQALRDKENLDDPAVIRRLVGEADIEVPPVILGANTFMRRWGVGLLVAGVGGAFWILYMIAAFRKKRAAPAR
jgi:hypothetical protein